MVFGLISDRWKPYFVHLPDIKPYPGTKWSCNEFIPSKALFKIKFFLLERFLYLLMILLFYYWIFLTWHSSLICTLSNSNIYYYYWIWMPVWTKYMEKERCLRRDKGPSTVGKISKWMTKYWTCHNLACCINFNNTR